MQIPFAHPAWKEIKRKGLFLDRWRVNCFLFFSFLFRFQKDKTRFLIIGARIGIKPNVIGRNRVSSEQSTSATKSSCERERERDWRKRFQHRRWQSTSISSSLKKRNPRMKHYRQSALAAKPRAAWTCIDPFYFTRARAWVPVEVKDPSANFGSLPPLATRQVQYYYDDDNEY